VCSSCYRQHYAKPKYVRRQLNTAWRSQVGLQFWLSINLPPIMDGIMATTGQTAGVTKTPTIAPVTTITTNVTTAASHVTDGPIHDNHEIADNEVHPTTIVGNRAGKDTIHGPGSAATATNAEDNTHGRLHIAKTDMTDRPRRISTLYKTMTISQKTKLRTRFHTAPILRNRYVRHNSFHYNI